MQKRKYNFKDVDMLLASQTIAESLKENLEELSMVRTKWTNEYVTELSARINTGIEKYLGLDKKESLRDATQKLAAIQVPALRDLSFIKTQIDVDFGDEGLEVLKKLGFTKHLKNVQHGDQEALIQLLYSFNKSMNETLKNKFIENGTHPGLIERIMGYAIEVNNANLIQENLKQKSKSISSEALQYLNAIYDEIIGICKIASTFYQFDKTTKEQFSFKKVVSAMSVVHKTKKEVLS